MLCIRWCLELTRVPPNVVLFNVDSVWFCKVLLALGDYMNVQCHACIGGTNVGEDIRKLDYGQHVVAGTPGRVFGNYGYVYCRIKYFWLSSSQGVWKRWLPFIDMIRRRSLRTRAIKMLVLDEADEMLNKGRLVSDPASCLFVDSTKREYWPLSAVLQILSNLLCAGFKEQIYDVYRYLPPATQVVLISATLPHEILEMTNKFMTDPIRILVKR